MEYSKTVGILPDPDSRTDHYDPTVDASIANVFAACAFRFAHTLLPVRVFLLQNFYKEIFFVKFYSWFILIRV